MRNNPGLLLVVALIAVPAIAIAEQPRVYRVGLILLVSLDRPQVRGLRDGLKEAGYIEGKNLLLEILTKGTPDELLSLVKSYNIEKFDVIVTDGVTVTRIAKQATEKIPIVFMSVSAPVRAGLVKSMARPGTNATGITFESIRPGTFGKQLEIFKKAVPTLRRLVLLYDDAHESPYHNINIVHARRVAARLGINLAEKGVKSLAEGEQVVASLSRDTTDGFAILCTSVLYGSKKIATMTTQKGIANLGCSTRQVTDWGALLSYSPDLSWIGHRAAWYVDQILKGAKPQELPVESPKKYDLVINLNTASRLDLTIPPELLILADKVIR